jgi:hypothetical protein
VADDLLGHAPQKHPWDALSAVRSEQDEIGALPSGRAEDLVRGIGPEDDPLTRPSRAILAQESTQVATDLPLVHCHPDLVRIEPR